MVTDLQKRTIQAIVNVFETSKAMGRYDAVTVLPGDAGHLTYGRSQTTLGSGNLAKLMQLYCDAPGCRFGAQIAPFLGRLRAMDFGLDSDLGFRRLLANAGEDPVMVSTQDRFFDSFYWDPAMNTASGMGIGTPLGMATVYDSTVHGSWAGMRDRTTANHGSLGSIGEKAWVRAYLQERRAWMASGAFAFSTVAVFRMDELLALADAENWDLRLPFRVRTVLLNEALFGSQVAVGPASLTPYSGFMVQGSFGQKGDFEVVVPHPAGGLAHLSRRNDDAALSWSAPTRFAQADGVASAVSLVQSSFSSGGNKGNLEVVAQMGGQLVAYWREDAAPFAWHGPFLLSAIVAGSITGNPAMVQGQAESKGNFEMVVPRIDGGLSHFWRNNADPARPWAKGVDVGRADGFMEAVAMIQTRTGALEVVARRADGRLLQYTRDAAMPLAWHGPVEVPLTGVPAGVRPVGVPALIQGRFGPNGNYELVTPLSTGGLAHLGRINDNPVAPSWTPAAVFALDAGAVDAVSLLQSTFGTAGLGSLELVARTGGRVRHYWRSDQPPFAWSSPGVVAFDL